MDPAKMMELQLQMRRNQEEFSDYLRELDGWENDIKQKEEQLKEQKTDETRTLPPVRNALAKKKKKKKPKPDHSPQPDLSVTNSTAPKRIRAYDYRSWDKFDVEKACEEVDKDSDGQKSSSSDYETDEEWEEERKKQLANEQKDQGNQLFKEGRYDEAIECYTRGIELDRSNVLLVANRAMALLKQQKYAAAELDCSAAISLDDVYIKAYARRGTARAALRKYKEAQEDFQKVLQLEPANKQAKAELAAVNRVLNPLPEQLSQSLACDTGLVKAIYKQPSDRSKKPLRRISIDEIGIDQTDRSKSAVKKHDSSDFDKFVKSGSNLEISEKRPATKHTNGTLDESQLSDNVSRAGDGDHETRLSHCWSPADVCSSSLVATTGDSARGDRSSSVTSSVDKVISMTTAVPTTSYQFQADWKVLRYTTDEFFQYFKQIDPHSYRKIFGEALDADMLSKILTTLSTFYISGQLDVYTVLHQLTTVSRFTMTAMFLTSSDKQALKKLFDYVRTDSSIDTKSVAALERLYG